MVPLRRPLLLTFFCACLFAATPVAAPAADITTSDVVVEGAQVHLGVPNSPRGGQLYVAATRHVSAGSGLVRLSVERIGKCHLQQVGPRMYVGACPILWSVEKELDLSAFSVDPVLRSANLSTKVRGRPLDLEWHGHGDMRTSYGTDTGYLLLLSRSSVTGGSWGGIGWELPEKPKKRDINEFGLYRRFEDP